MARFDGRVAFITGGGRGIGAATARLFAAEGAAVAICDLDTGPAEAVATELRAAGGKALAIQLDVTRREQMEAAVAETVAEFGRLDCLVSLAGITRDALLYKMTDDEFDSVISTHLKGSFLAAQVCQREMVKQKYGKIVLTSSVSALGNRGQTNYAAAKAGMQGMTATLAIELGPFGINVNCVAPGLIETRMTRAIADNIHADWEQMKAAVAAVTPLRRVGQPEDVARAIAFLCSEDAAYITGHTLYIDGGRKGVTN